MLCQGGPGKFRLSFVGGHLDRRKSNRLSGKAANVGIPERWSLVASPRRFLARGFFPKEIPPALRSDSYARSVTAGTTPPFPDSKAAELTPHSLARAGGVRRALAIPNPIPYFHLIFAIADNWDAIRQHLAKSTLSASRPKLRGATMGRSASPSIPFTELPVLRARSREHGRYVLLADIAEFYGSVYTHSIPWALHGKQLAKDNRNDMSLLGNILDLRIRSTQDRQTNGIPIGPDASLIIAETILAQVDHELTQAVANVQGFRFFDDYELTFASLSAAEEALAALHRITADYNLRLNAVKTRIEPLPLPHDVPWRHRIRNLDPTGTNPVPSLIAYFDEAFTLKIQNPGEAVVGYAVSRLESAQVNADSWRLVMSLLLQAISAEPSSIQQVATLIARRHAEGEEVQAAELHKGLNSFIHHHATRNHGSEVAWAIWLAVSFSIGLESEVSGAVSRMLDPCVALLALI